MKKKIIITLVIVLLILVIPVPTTLFVKDGGTKAFTSLTYKIVDWNRLYGAGDVYEATKIYPFPLNFLSLDKLFEREEKNLIHTDIEIDHAHTPTNTDDELYADCGNTITTIAFSDSKEFSFMGGESVYLTNLLSSFWYSNLDACKCEAPVTVITEFGEYSVNPTSLARCTRGQANFTEEQAKKVSEIVEWARTKATIVEYTGSWIEKTENNLSNRAVFDDIRITKIYSDCFMAVDVIPTPYQYKINGSIEDKWCTNDQVTCKIENVYFDQKSRRYEADLVSIEPSYFEPDPDVCYKPVIYLYPEKTTNVSVTLDLNGALSCTYPAYNNGWQVTAKPDGTLFDKNGKQYNYLYWEGEIDAEYDFSEGFCVKGEDTALFLETALEKLGLNRKEANEFIVYWLPLMQNNPYNVIAFQTDAYTNGAKLNINPAPDTLIRVFMAYKPSNEFVKIKEQTLSAPQRCGFTAVEWGGGIVK